MDRRCDIFQVGGSVGLWLGLGALQVKKSPGVNIVNIFNIVKKSQKISRDLKKNLKII